MTTADDIRRLVDDAAAPVTLDEVTTPRTTRSPRRAGPVAVVSAAAAVAVVAGVIVSQGGASRTTVRVQSPPTTTGGPAATTPTTVPAPPVTVPAAGPVPGHPVPASVVARCAEATGDEGGAPVLRDAVTDSAATTLLITTPAGWSTCAIPPGGQPTGSGSYPFRSWARADGWDLDTPGFPIPTDATNVSAGPPPTDAPALWLTAPVETLDGGSEGIVRGGWEVMYLGRAAPDVAAVRITLLTGITETVPVVDGTWIADQLVRHFAPFPRTSSRTPIEALDRAGDVVWDDTSATTALCFATTSGALITPDRTDVPCTTGVPW